jgi:hypothetical protein
MPPLTINVHVSARAAILAGKANVGSQSFTVTEEALKDLPGDLRLELALAYESGEALGKDPSEPIVEATLEAIRPVLEARASRRAKIEEERRAQAANEAELAVVSAKEATARSNASSKALRMWIEKNGDEEQKARMAEGFLPEEEILDAICEEMLDLPGFPPYEVLRKGDACDCGCGGRVKIEQSAPRHMDAFQFAKLQAAREAAPEGATVTAIEHRAACPACRCVPIARLEARVTLEWNGWLLVRQYALI